MTVAGSRRDARISRPWQARQELSICRRCRCVLDRLVIPAATAFQRAGTSSASDESSPASFAPGIAWGPPPLFVQRTSIHMAARIRRPRRPEPSVGFPGPGFFGSTVSSVRSSNRQTVCRILAILDPYRKESSGRMREKSCGDPGSLIHDRFCASGFSEAVDGMGTPGSFRSGVISPQFLNSLMLSAWVIRVPPAHT